MEGSMKDLKITDIKIERKINNMEQFSIAKHWDEFMNERLVVNCKTKRVSDLFLKYCSLEGIQWGSGCKLTTRDYWDSYDSEICYSHCNGMSISSRSYYEEEKYKIVEFTGFNIEVKSKLNYPTTTTKENIEVIYHKRETIVLLNADSKHYKGVSRCNYQDTYDKNIGFVVAYERARENQKRGKY